jgi:hypothetical protein
LFFSLQGTGPVYGINQKKIAFYATTPTLQIGVLYTNNEVSIDTWHHVMIVKNSNLISLYLDGILSSSTNYPNLQLSNETGIIIPVKNEIAIFDTMQLIYHDKDLFQNLQSKSRVNIVSRFQQELVWNNLLQEYKRLEKNV